MACPVRTTSQPEMSITTPATPQQSHAWEVAYAPASEAFIKNQSIAYPSFEFLRQYNGALEMFSGIELENPNVLVVIDWVSLEAHEAYEKTPAYQEYITLLTPEIAGGATPVHVHFVVSPDGALRAPITEVLWVTPKTDATQSDVVATLDKLVAYANNPRTGVIAASYGPVVETPGTYIVVVGWSSFKAYVSECPSGTLHDLFKALPSFAEHYIRGKSGVSFGDLVGELSKKAEVTDVHSVLTEFN
ncbi:hypothetical protein FA95DRAFT_1671931 [Auriscalpium vulgare]|uniref:Uncharacterized protein n=1 Tax=Auriscalpium vulgare TaxID=40419 RepID=A0ACB8RPD8_9AGAM|nr:hypothetical protein FA95DRAFT_1671931 [Auriscalpium vulgare]